MIKRLRSALVFLWLLTTVFGGFTLAFSSHLPEFGILIGVWLLSAFLTIVVGGERLSKWIDGC